MEQVGIADFAEKPLFMLSGGMRQNAYIAMALAQDTDYILLDEPTTYLDIAHQLELMRLLKQLSDNGKGIVTVMHDLPLAFDFSDTLTVMNNGGIIACGTPSGLLHEDSLEEETAMHSSILAWKILWTEEPVRLQSTQWQKVRRY